MSAADLNCLSFKELAQYHGHMQFYVVDEYVDSEGDLLTDKTFLEEWHVRDDWMEGYSKISVGKNSTRVYDTEGQLLHEAPRERDANESFLSEAQAKNYGFLDLSDSFVQQLKKQLIVNGCQVSEDNGVLLAKTQSMVFSYDPSEKTMFYALYDASGVKTQEIAIEYALDQNKETYYPVRETIYEWFLSDSGCCIRKVTSYRRFQFERENYNYEGPRVRTQEKQSALMDDLQILQDAQAESFRIASEKWKGELFEIEIYDIAGKMIYRGPLREGQKMDLPSASRAGMYVLHIKISSKKQSLRKKILNLQNGITF